MKKILIVTLEFPPQVGGIATYVDTLAGALEPVQTLVLAPPRRVGVEAPAKDTQTFDTSRPYRILRASLLAPGFFWPRWLKLVFIVRKIVRQEKVELIMLHHVLPVGYVAYIIKKLCGVPYLIFSHGTDVLAASSSHWKTHWLRVVVRASEQIIFNSQSLKDRWLRVAPDFGRRSLVLYPCPDDNFYTAPAATEVKALRQRFALEGKRVILSISRLAEGKGFPHLIRVMAEVVKQDPNVVWLIVGAGPKQDAILADIQKKSLQNVVRFAGEVAHPAVKAYYYLSDLFVLLTHPDEGREEGLGLVFLEAAAAGVPVVAGRSGGVDEAVVHAQTGLIFDVYREGRQIAEAILELLHNHDYAERLGQQARERMRREFNWARQLKKLMPWIQ